VPRLHGGGGIDWAAGERPIIGLIGERMLNRREAADYERMTAMRGVAPSAARIGLDVRVSVDEGGNIVPLIQKVAGAEADLRIDHHDRFKLPRLIQRHRRTSMLETGRG
jgi:L-alanine-DL-glutamate epimerase-like enolase superfamily enzyme